MIAQCMMASITSLCKPIKVHQTFQLVYELYPWVEIPLKFVIIIILSIELNYNLIPMSFVCIVTL